MHTMCIQDSLPGGGTTGNHGEIATGAATPSFHPWTGTEKLVEALHRLPAAFHSEVTGCYCCVVAASGVQG